MATPVLINPGNVEGLPEAAPPPTEDGAVGGWVSAPPPGRSALLGEPDPGPATAPNEGRRVRRRPVGEPPGRRPWARIATTRTENSEGIQNRRNTTSNTERTKGTDTREREHGGQVEVTSRNEVEMARRDGVDHVLSTMPRGRHPTGRLWRRTSSSLVRLRTSSTGHSSWAIHPVLSDDRDCRDRNESTCGQRTYTT